MSTENIDPNEFEAELIVSTYDELLDQAADTINFAFDAKDVLQRVEEASKKNEFGPIGHIARVKAQSYHWAKAEASGDLDSTVTIETAIYGTNHLNQKSVIEGGWSIPMSAVLEMAPSVFAGGLEQSVCNKIITAEEHLDPQALFITWRTCNK